MCSQKLFQKDTLAQSTQYIKKPTLIIIRINCYTQICNWQNISCWGNRQTERLEVKCTCQGIVQPSRVYAGM